MFTLCLCSCVRIATARHVRINMKNHGYTVHGIKLFLQRNNLHNVRLSFLLLDVHAHWGNRTAYHAIKCW